MYANGSGTMLGAEGKLVRKTGLFLSSGFLQSVEYGWSLGDQFVGFVDCWIWRMQGTSELFLPIL